MEGMSLMRSNLVGMLVATAHSTQIVVNKSDIVGTHLETLEVEDDG